MKVGDLVRETTKMDRKCSLGLILKTQPCRAALCKCGKEEYFIHFFDDDDQCWMSQNFVETANKKMKLNEKNS